MTWPDGCSASARMPVCSATGGVCAGERAVDQRRQRGVGPGPVGGALGVELVRRGARSRPAGRWPGWPVRRRSPTRSGRPAIPPASPGTARPARRRTAARRTARCCPAGTARPRCWPGRRPDAPSGGRRRRRFRRAAGRHRRRPHRRRRWWAWLAPRRQATGRRGAGPVERRLMDRRSAPPIQRGPTPVRQAQPSSSSRSSSMPKWCATSWMTVVATCSRARLDVAGVRQDRLAGRW